MISERRTRTLRDLAARTGKAQTTEEALVLAAQILADSNLDLPFVLFYLLDPHGKHARLIAHTGLGPDTAASPATIDIEAPGRPTWPLADVVRTGEAGQLDALEARFGPLSCGPYPESPQTALTLPVTPPGCEHPAAILVAGVSSRLPLNDSYRAFSDLLAASVTTAVANARAHEENRKRAEALAEVDREKTAFFSNVSHEFRTPLTLMLGPLEDELAEQASPLPPDRRERLETAHRNALRLLKLVNTLLDFSRIEAGRNRASYEPIDLAAFTGDLASVFRSAVEKAGLTLSVSCPPLPEPVYIDRDMWEKVVLNLVSNAFKHTFDGGISVALAWDSDHVELRVTDSGIGISEAELPRLFERFHRVKGAKSRTHEGTGIGLALVQQLVSVHDGTVRVESQEGKGSTFIVRVKTGSAHVPVDHVRVARALVSTATGAAAYVEEAQHWLPNAPDGLVASPPWGDRVCATRATQEENGRVGGPRARILLADDNADMRDYVRRLLIEHYDVTAVSDGALALAAARDQLPDLVLSDVMMPGLDGFGLVRELRIDERTRTIPVILLSARAGEEAALEGLDTGADDYLVKPFSARELSARVRTHLLLARSRRQWAEELAQANKELEAFSYTVSHDLRAPLRAIDGFSTALLESQAARLDDKGRSYLGRVRAATARMSTLIDDLLSLSRITRSPCQRMPTSLTEAVRGILDELHRRDPGRDVVVEVENGLSAQADARLLQVALDNLLGNAWKFTGTRSDARIQFGKTIQDGQTAFFVRDNGAGFDMAYADKLFQPFQRLHTESEFEGTGIGLATVHRVVSRHGGRIWAESAVGAGATFFFTLGNDT
jgi:signal transduction histidine kinase